MVMNGFAGDGDDDGDDEVTSSSSVDRDLSLSISHLITTTTTITITTTTTTTTSNNNHVCGWSIYITRIHDLSHPKGPPHPSPRRQTARPSVSRGYSFSLSSTYLEEVRLRVALHLVVAGLPSTFFLFARRDLGDRRRHGVRRAPVGSGGEVGQDVDHVVEDRPPRTDGRGHA